MECEDAPDLGLNNAIAYTWNSETLYKTMINISCEVGQLILDTT